MSRKSAAFNARFKELFNSTSGKQIYVRALANEEQFEDYLPYAFLIGDDKTIQTKQRQLIQCIRLDGINAATSADSVIDDIKNLFASIIANADPQFSYYVHKVSKHINYDPSTITTNDFAAELDEAWLDHLTKTGSRDVSITISLISSSDILMKVGGLFGKLRELSRDYKTERNDAYHADIADRLSSLNELSSLIVSTFGHLNTRIDGHDTIINNVTNTVNNQGDRITKNEGDITNINNTLNDHGDRITKNEGDITNINNTLNDHGDRITKNEGDIIDIKGDITDIKGDITTINNTLDNHETRITKNEGDIAELQDSAVKYDKDSNGNKTGNVTLDAGTGQAVGLGNVAAGKTGNDAVNVDQLNGALAGLGGGAKVEADGTVTKPTYNVGGANYNNVGDALKAQGDLSVQYVADENGKPTNKIILTGNGDGGAVSIGNVKAAEADHEAVNYGQVKDNISYDRNPDGSRSNVVTMKGGSNGSVAIRNVSDGVNDSDAATYRQVKQSYKDSKDYTDQQVNNLRDSSNEKFSALNGELAEVRKESRAGIASAMAAAGLRYDDRAGKGSIAMGMGGFKNATSIAAGVGYTSEDGNWRLNSAIAHSFSGSATSWNAGVSWTFN